MSERDTRASAVEALLGADAVSVDGSGRITASPARVGEISELLRWAGREGVAVRTTPARPLGSRPSFPGRGEILLQLDRLGAAVTIHEQAGTVDVAGGTTGAELAWHLHREGRWVQPRPVPFFREPLGAFLAGPGLAGEWVALSMWETPLMSVEAVLLDGRVLRTGVAPRSAAGPDYRAFLVGARDRVGVITGATWRTSARSVPALFAARFPHRDAALAMVREHAARGWRPWASRVIPGRRPGRWNDPGAAGDGDAAVALLCHRAEGSRAELIRRLLHEGTQGHGGEVLEASDARAWYEGAVRAVCLEGPAALPGLDLADGEGALATAWFAVPWAGLGALWREISAGKGLRASAAVLGEAFRPEGGLLQVRLSRPGRSRITAPTALRWLLQRAAAHQGRLAGLLDDRGRQAAPPLPATPADALIGDVVTGLLGETTAALNPRPEGGR